MADFTINHSDECGFEIRCPDIVVETDDVDRVIVVSQSNHYSTEYITFMYSEARELAERILAELSE